MAEEMNSENNIFSEFQGLLTLTLTQKWVQCHTVAGNSSTSTHVPNFVKIGDSLRGRTDGKTGFNKFFWKGDDKKRNPTINFHLVKKAYSLLCLVIEMVPVSTLQKMKALNNPSTSKAINLIFQPLTYNFIQFQGLLYENALTWP